MDFIKALSVLGLLSILTVAPKFASANTREETIQNDGLLRDVRELALRCVVEPFTINSRGEKITGELKSICNELQPDRRGGVTLYVRGQKLHAFVLESENSDGGDLDHLIIMNLKGNIIAERKEILAFDNIFIALAGGDSEFRQVQEN